MKLKFYQILDSKQADVLIERYYEGLTTTAEEQQLRKFLSQTNLPAQYATEQAMFGYFSQKRKKPTVSLKPYIRWAGAAAIIIAFMINMQIYALKSNGNYAYVNGKKITNITDIKSHAISSLSDISNGNEEIEKGLSDLNNHPTDQALSVFSGIE